MRQCDCLLNHQTRAKCCRNPMVSAECYAHDENACREPRSSDTHAEKLCVLRVNRMYLSIVHEEDEESVHTRSSLSALASTRPARSARWPQRQRRNSFTVVCVVCIRTSIPHYVYAGRFATPPAGSVPLHTAVRTTCVPRVQHLHICITRERVLASWCYVYVYLFLLRSAVNKYECTP